MSRSSGYPLPPRAWLAAVVLSATRTLTAGCASTPESVVNADANASGMQQRQQGMPRHVADALTELRTLQNDPGLTYGKLQDASLLPIASNAMRDRLIHVIEEVSPAVALMMIPSTNPPNGVRWSPDEAPWRLDAEHVLVPTIPLATQPDYNGKELVGELAAWKEEPVIDRNGAGSTATGTAFLVAPQLIAIADHGVVTEDNVTGVCFFFRYQKGLNRETPTGYRFRRDELYQGQRVVAEGLTQADDTRANIPNSEHWKLIELDRPVSMKDVTIAPPLWNRQVPGQRASLALGHPLGLRQQIVGAKTKNNDAKSPCARLFYDMALLPGASGGPVITVQSNSSVPYLFEGIVAAGNGKVSQTETTVTWSRGAPLTMVTIPRDLIKNNIPGAKK